MYKFYQEFTFSWSRIDTDEVINFRGDIVLKGTDLNITGGLSDNNFEPFISVINNMSMTPEVLSLELIARTIYDRSKPLYPNLYKIVLQRVGHPQIAEYYETTGNQIDGFQELFYNNFIN